MDIKNIIHFTVMALVFFLALFVLYASELSRKNKKDDLDSIPKKN